MKRLFLALSLLSIPCSLTADNKKSFWPTWLTFKKQTSYFHLPIMSKSVFERSTSEKAGICAGVGITAALATAMIFFLQASHISTTRR